MQPGQTSKQAPEIRGMAPIQANGQALGVRSPA